MFKNRSSGEIGYAALIKTYALRGMPCWGAVKDTPRAGVAKGNATLMENLVYALENEGVSLGVLSAVFEKVNRTELEGYIRLAAENATVRRIWFLFEWLMCERLNVEDLCKSDLPYVEAMDSILYYTSEGVESKRHRVYDNLLGDVRYCPVIRRTAKLKAFEDKMRPQGKNRFAGYPREVLTKALGYLQSRESHEIAGLSIADGAQNVAERMDDYDFFNKQDLVMLQNRIAEKKKRNIGGYRQHQIYVFKDWEEKRELIFVAPRCEDVAWLMDGMYAANKRLSSVHPVVHAAAISFGFVYIHPFSDGNGRTHRFLAQNILARREFMPAGLLFPMSAVMDKDSKVYNEGLKILDTGFLRAAQEEYERTGAVKVPGKTYRYLDMTHQAETLFELVENATMLDIVPEVSRMAADKNALQAAGAAEMIPQEIIERSVKLCIENISLTENKPEDFLKLITPEVRKALQSTDAGLALNGSEWTKPHNMSFDSAWRVLGLLTTSIGANVELSANFPTRPYLPESFMRKETKRLVSRKAAFSLIELLVALSILAVVAAIIVPRFLNIQQQAVETMVSDHITQLNGIYQQWLALGGSYPGFDEDSDHKAPYKIIQFLGAQYTGSDPTRGLAAGPRDAMGALSSSMVSFSGLPCVTKIAADGSVTNGYPTDSSPDGLYLYANANDAASNMHANVYIKNGGFVYEIELAYTGGGIRFASTYLEDLTGYGKYMYGKYKVGGPRSAV